MVSVYSVGVVGYSGRMGSLLCEQIKKNNHFSLGACFRKSACNSTLDDVFLQNDCIVDFSNKDLLDSVLGAFKKCPKPFILCTTGWDYDFYINKLRQLGEYAPIVVASNTSFGSFLHKFISLGVSCVLNDEYDVDIFEKHHKNKLDIPSGTAMSIARDIKNIKKTLYDKNYEFGFCAKGPRKKDFINFCCSRAGNVFGEHKVEFSGASDMISVDHVVFDRNVFAVGALNVVKWLYEKNPQYGFYDMNDVFGNIIKEKFINFIDIFLNGKSL